MRPPKIIMKDYEIVVGIDFGTTYSGVSWAVRSQSGDSSRIRAITNWPCPGRHNATHDKVPSVISYKNGKPSKWGYEAEHLDDSCHWFKLLLDPKNIEKPEHFKMRPRSLKKTAQDMAGDYLGLIWEYTKNDISERLRNSEWGKTHALKVILTVPAVWSATAKSRTLQAARTAGLPTNITLVPEPEAAALAVLRDKDKMRGTEPDDVFVICDAGGGTVDLITYKVKRLNSLEVGETAQGDGDFCGSVYLDQEFERYITKRVSNYEKIEESHRRKLLEEFEYNIKRHFTLNSTKSYVVDLKGAKDNPAEGVEDGSILLKPDAIRMIFNKIYEQIGRLIDKQIEQVEAKGMRVKSIFLVGGFGDNYFLCDRLVESYSSRDVSILQADNGWSSVCRGATMWGLENSKTGRTVTSRVARLSYGVSGDNTKMHWLLKKGEEFEDDEIKDYDLGQNVQFSHWDWLSNVNFKQTLYSSESANPPTYLDKSVNEHCSVECKLPCVKLFFWENSLRNLEIRERGHILNLKLAMVHRNAQLEFSVTYRGNKVATCVSRYTDGFYNGLYTKLESNQIRYVLIQRATSDTDRQINIELITTEFDREKEYEALSYAWGPQDDKTPIRVWVGKHCFDYPVANNLAAALKSLRYQDKDRLLWIDALCINQQDPEERSSQLGKMHLYYRYAINVCIWLGKESDNSDIAMDFIYRILDFSALEKPAGHRAYRPKWVALSKLLAREWFNRRWVIQETVLAKKATVCCGTKTVSWLEFADAVAIISDTKWNEVSRVLTRRDAQLLGEVFARGARTMIHMSSNLFRRDHEGNIVERLQDMENLLSNLQMFNVAHAADTVYAILELARDTSDLGSISVGSRLPPEELFTKVIMIIIKRSGSLDTLFRPWAPECPLPSWVLTVDGSACHPCQWDRRFGHWDPGALVGPPGKSVYNAADKMPENAKQYSTKHGNDVLAILSVSGIRADAIGKIGEVPSLGGRIPPEWLLLAGWSDPNSTVPGDFWRTIVGDRDADGQSPPGWYRRACQHVYGRARGGGPNVDARHIQDIEPFHQRVRSVIQNRRFIITGQKKFLGLGPATCQPDDFICILFGCSVPVVLRQAGKYYRLVGECYIHGMMDGEMIKAYRASGVNADTFEIL